MYILTINKKKDEKFVRTRTKPFHREARDRNELNRLVREMRATMKRADGIGLSANQVGIGENFFVAEVDNKFYAVFNPAIEKASDETAVLEEGCLSVPGVFGPVERPEKVVLTGVDANGKKIKIKAWGLLARVFQHEVDHLNGVLFVDRAQSTHTEEARGNK